MADIYSVTDGGTYHFDDPNAWQGGVVPGPSDRAIIRYRFTQINDGAGIHYWTGSRAFIQVDTTQYLPDSGSFYTHLRTNSERVKIDYESKDTYKLYSCSIDTSYYDWQPGILSGSNIGYIRNDTPVYGTDFTTIYLSGSAIWEVRRVDIEDRSEFIMKDQATLRLNSTTGDSFVHVVDGNFTAIDEVTCELTGSTRRNSSFISDGGAAYKSILVSGSTDYRSATRTTSTVPVGSCSIPVSDTTNFGKGDIISLYTLEDTEDQVTLTGNEEYNPYEFTATGSIYPLHFKRKIVDNDETVQVVSKDANNLYVRKVFGKEGDVIESSNSETRQSFQRKYKKVAKKFTGTKTSIVVRSGHNDFKAGDKIVVGSNIYTVLEAASKLIPHKTVDFSQGAGLEDFFVDEMIGSGSSDSYKVNSHMKSGSFLAQDEALVGGNNYYRSFFLKDTKLRDAKITLSGSVVDATGSYNSNRMVGLSFGDEAYERDRILPFYNRQGYANEHYIGVYGSNLKYGRMSHDVVSLDTRNYEEYSGVDTTQSPFEITIDRLKENTDFYFNGDFLTNFTNINITSDVGIHLCRAGSRISKLVVEEYVQELLLDTSDSIGVGTKIYEGGTVVEHPSNQSIVKLASTIKDLRGYNDLFAQRSLENISGSFVPLFWSNQGDRTYYRSSDTTAEVSSTAPMLKAYPWRREFRTKSSGDRYFDINLTEQVTFDAIGIAHYYARNNAYLKGFGVEVSDDGHTWTVVKAQADDTRVGSGASNLRIFRFTETTARFLRIRVNGGSTSGNNYIDNLTLYHFNGRGTSIELNDSTDYPVGAKLQFIPPQGHFNTTYSYVRYTSQTGYVNGSQTNDDIVGTMYPTYTVTAKSGNVITLDREVEAEYLVPDILVVRVDRAIKVTSGGTYPIGLMYGSTSANPRNIEFYNVSADSCGTNNRERNYWYLAPYLSKFNLINSYINYLVPRDDTMYAAGLKWKNNVLSNHTTLNITNTLRLSDAVIHGNIGSNYYTTLNLSSAIGHYITGNIFSSDRRMSISSFITQDGGTKPTIVRNNHFTGREYITFTGGHNNDALVNRMIDFHDNTLNFNSGYYRWNQSTSELFTGPNKAEWPTAYPSVKSNTYYRSGTIGSRKRSTLGAAVSERQLFMNDPELGYRSHLSDNGVSKIIEKLDSNEFDIIAEHLNRHNGVLMKSDFIVSQTQQVRVVVNIDYYNDSFLRENDYHRTRLIPRLVLIGPDSRTITLRELPYQDKYRKFTFDHTFTASPGNYYVALVKYNPAYGERVMTFRSSNCLIKGTHTDSIFISNNGFIDYMLLQSPQKLRAGNLMQEGLDVMKNNPNRTTVKFRKIKF